MSDILQQLLTLSEKGTVEHRCAALLVLGALKIENSSVVKTVGTALEHPNPVIKDYALRYLEEVRPKTAVSLVLKYLDDQDKEIQERVVRLLVNVGQPAVQALLQGLPTASRPGQLNAARVLCALHR